MTCMDVGMEFRWWRVALATLGLTAIGVWYLLVVDSVQGKIQFFSWAPLATIVPSMLLMLAWGLKEKGQPPLEFQLLAFIGYVLLTCSLLFGVAMALRHQQGYFTPEVKACFPGVLGFFAFVASASYLSSTLREKQVTGGILLLPLIVCLVGHALLLRVALLS